MTRLINDDYYDYPPHMLRRTYICAMRQGHLFICGLCGLPIARMRQLTIDHIVPKSKGGSHNYENLQPAHKRCNNTKGNEEPVIEFMVYKPNTVRFSSLQKENA